MTNSTFNTTCAYSGSVNVCVCVCVCVYIVYIYTHTHTYTNTHTIYIYTYLFIYLFIYLLIILVGLSAKCILLIFCLFSGFWHLVPSCNCHFPVFIFCSLFGNNRYRFHCSDIHSSSRLTWPPLRHYSYVICCHFQEFCNILCQQFWNLSVLIQRVRDCQGEMFKPSTKSI